MRMMETNRPASLSSRACGSWAGATVATSKSTTALAWGNAALIRKYAEELVALSPDVLFCSGAATVAPLLQVTRTVPIIFAGVVDPVGAGFVDTLARPGGNATGFILFEYSLGGKWLELLKTDRATGDASGGY